MRTPDRAVINGGLQWPRWTWQQNESFSFALSHMSLPHLGERGSAFVGVQPNVCPSPACCAPAPNAATELAVPSLMTSKYLAAL